MLTDSSRQRVTKHDVGRRAGRGTIVARHDASNGTTVLATARADSPLRFVRPTFHGSRAAAVCAVTFGGGLVDGDSIDIDVSVERDATLVLFTQSTTKAFRGSTAQSVSANVHGTLVLLPDPVSCFRGASYAQHTDVSLQGDGSVIVLDAYTAGRAAFGERWAFDALRLSTTIRQEGRVVLRDAVHLTHEDGPIDARMGAFDALASLCAVGSRMSPVIEHVLAANVVSEALVAAASPLAATSGAIVRIASTTAAGCVDEARRRLGGLRKIGVTDPFASRY